MEMILIQEMDKIILDLEMIMGITDMETTKMVLTVQTRDKEEEDRMAP